MRLGMSWLPQQRRQIGIDSRRQGLPINDLPIAQMRRHQRQMQRGVWRPEQEHGHISSRVRTELVHQLLRRPCRHLNITSSDRYTCQLIVAGTYDSNAQAKMINSTFPTPPGTKTENFGKSQNRPFGSKQLTCARSRWAVRPKVPGTNQGSPPAAPAASPADDTPGIEDIEASARVRTPTPVALMIAFTRGESLLP
jgi:hypothetical protein